MRKFGNIEKTFNKIVDLCEIFHVAQSRPRVMAAVWRSYMLKYKEPPPNAFKLVNYSRTHPRHPELS